MSRRRVPVVALAQFGCLCFTVWRKRLPPADPADVTLDVWRMCWYADGRVGVLPVDRL